MKTKATKRGPAEKTSPYTRHTAEAAITHLERILSTDGADSIFSRTYWRARVEQVKATQGLAPEQQARLARLLKSLGPLFGDDGSS
ncbi:hypothetical protein EVC45_27485 [Paraburkholderia sp. UYCP14C]|nr:hypothetical protein EVC45_27485 [Paraburkholderia sp. UYCP14C]